jgi:hypothetical protein
MILGLISVVSALKCWSNGNGIDGTPPFKYNLDMLNGTHCVHQIYGKYEYYTALSDAQLQTTIDSFATTPKGWPYGLLSCDADFCNDPSIKIDTKLGSGPAAWTGSVSNAKVTFTPSGEIKLSLSLLSIIACSFSL